MDTKKENKKNYSISPDSARELSRQAINLSEDLGKTVPKHRIIEVLIALLVNNKDTYSRVKNAIKNI